MKKIYSYLIVGHLLIFMPTLLMGQSKEELYAKGNEYFEMNDLDNASKYYLDAINLDNDYYPVQIKMAYIALLHNRYEESTEIFNNVLLKTKSDSMKAQANCGLSQVFFSGNDDLNARSFINKALEYDSLNITFLMVSGDLYFETNALKLANFTYSKILELDSLNYRARNYRALVLETSDKLDSAIDDYNFLYKYHSEKKPEFLVPYSRCFLKSSKFEDSKRIMDQIDEDNTPSQEEYTYLLASYYFEKGDYYDAKPYFLTLAKVSKKDYYRFLVARNFYYLGGEENLKKAKKWFNKTDKNYETCLKSIYHALICMDQQSYDKANAYLEKAEEYDSTNSFVYVAKSKLHILQKSYDEAFRLSSKAIKLNEENGTNCRGEDYFYRAIVLSHQNQGQKACLDYNKAKSISPQIYKLKWIGKKIECE